MAFAALAATSNGQLDPHFYDAVCPEALPAIEKAVEEAVAVEPRMGASLLRLHFHDCFVNVRVLARLIVCAMRAHYACIWIAASLASTHTYVMCARMLHACA